MATAKHPWKRNLLKVPQELLDKARNNNGPVVVAVAKQLKVDDIQSGVYAHLGIHVEGEKLRVEPNVAPPSGSGRWSRTNADGAIKRLKHLPMITKEYSFETPNFGNWSKGSHPVSWERMVYQREYIPPKNLSIQVTVIEPGTNIYLVRFALDEVLDPHSPDLEKDLLYDLNVLQENVGAVDIYPTDASLADYRITLTVNWEVLPPGERERNISIIVRDLPPNRVHEVLDRYKFLESLNPTKIVVGTSGFVRYYGALLPSEIVVFDNTRYGNAVYIMGENWQSNSKLSRTELLAKAQRDFIRVPHRPGWKDRVHCELATLKKLQEDRRAAPGEDDTPTPSK